MSLSLSFTGTSEPYQELAVPSYTTAERVETGEWTLVINLDQLVRRFGLVQRFPESVPVGITTLVNKEQLFDFLSDRFEECNHLQQIAEELNTAAAAIQAIPADVNLKTVSFERRLRESNATLDAVRQLNAHLVVLHAKYTKLVKDAGLESKIFDAEVETYKNVFYKFGSYTQTFARALEQYIAKTKLSCKIQSAATASIPVRIKATSDPAPIQQAAATSSEPVAGVAAETEAVNIKVDAAPVPPDADAAADAAADTEDSR